MLTPNEQHQVHDLLEAGLAVADVAKRTQKSLATIYKYKQLGRKIQSHKRRRDGYKVPKELVPHVDFLDAHIKKSTTKPQVLYFKLQREGYTNSRKLFEEYYRVKKQDFHPYRRSMEHRVTEPGEEAQVDWAHFGELTINGKREKIFLFVYILSWSRAFYMEFVAHQNQKTLQACHIHAFERLGIARTILYDNMKTVVNRREKLPDGTKRPLYNDMFLRFTQHYQFKPEACSPRWPQAKGKVEASINYARRHFSRCTPRLDVTIEELNEWLSRWIEDIAHQRIHRETREKPAKLWAKEKPFLSFPTNIPRYNLSACREYTATEWGVINYKSNHYNFGSSYARKKLDIREIQKHGIDYMEIYRKNILIKVVPLLKGKNGWLRIELPDLSPGGMPLEEDKKGKTNKRPRAKRPKIDVEQRDLSYYSAILDPIGG